MSVGLDRNKVILVEYDDKWPAIYDKEASLLVSLLGSEVLFIDHIGSTSVPGMKAKPVIDILVQVPTDFLSKSGEEILLGSGYLKTFFERRKEPMYSKTLRGDIATHNVHVTRKGSILANALLNFRNALRADNGLAKRYLKLKIDLAESHPDNRKAYYEAKISFFESVVGKYFDLPN